MNKNNFFVKFAHFYIINIKRIINAAVEIWDIMKDDVLPGLMKTTLDMLIITVRALQCILPLNQIREALMTQYITRKEIKELTGQNIRDEGRYFYKKGITEARREKAAENGGKNANENT
jgi:hypothetical protein